MEAEVFEREVQLGQGITKTFVIKITLHSVNIFFTKKGFVESVYGPNTRAYVVGLTAKEKTDEFFKLEYKLIPSKEDLQNCLRVYLRYKENLMVNREVYIREVNKLLDKLNNLVCQNLLETAVKAQEQEILA